MYDAWGKLEMFAKYLSGNFKLLPTFKKEALRYSEALDTICKKIRSHYRKTAIDIKSLLWLRDWCYFSKIIIWLSLVSAAT